MCCFSRILALFKESKTMTKSERESVAKEFKTFRAPEHFSGGCKKSGTQPGYCGLLTWEGKLSKIQMGCPLYKQCEGRKFLFVLEDPSTYQKPNSKRD